MIDFSSPYYPYEKVDTGFNTLKGAEEIPYKILMYLLDLPDKNGYEPVDDNERPRVRLAKYLWYDESNPLSYPLPTPEQKLSMLYDGKSAMLATEEERQKHPKGYRIRGQSYTEPSEIYAKVLLKCYMGRMIARSDYKTILGLKFDVVANYALDNITKTMAYSRTYAIVQCIIEALHGVNIAGIGTVYFNKTIHGDSGMTTFHNEGTDIYDQLFMAIEWQETTTPDVVQSFNLYNY